MVQIDSAHVKGEGRTLWDEMYKETVPKNPGRKKKETPLSNPWQPSWYARNREKVLVQQRAYRLRSGVIDKKRRADYHTDRKRLVLEHYGKEGKAVCCWPGCECDDLDMLSLDHVYNDGAEHRRNLGQKTIVIYRWCIREGFPPGFQTLCMNHQCKKQLLHLRANRGY